jgi:putative FmdB family regulatory protein
MPTYQYACTSQDCGLRFERVQAFTDPAITECPDCSDRVRKVYGSVGVVFKGSGFYRNDSRDAKAGAAAAKTDSDGSAGAKSGDGAKTSESTKGDGGSSSGKADSSSGSAGSGGSKTNDKSAAASKPAASVPS